MVNEYRCYGPPGTGKTTWLSKKIRSAASTFGAASILVASFTRAAARELVGRDLPLEKRQLGTLHSFCFRMLGHPEIAEAPKHIEEWNSVAWPNHQLGARKIHMDDPLDSGTRLTHGDQLLGEAGKLRGQQIPFESWPQRTRAFHERWVAWKQENELVDFTDMVEIALRDIDEPPFPAAVGFYDEVQDMTSTELALARKWGSHFSHIMMAGDDDQTIYAFRGALPDAFLDPELPEDNKVFLPRTWRMAREVKEFSERWIQGVSRRQEKHFEPVREGGEVARSATCWKHASEMAGEICEELEKREGDIMLLAPCSYLLGPTLGALRDEGVPFCNPYRVENGAWNPLRGGCSRLATFMDPAPERDGGRDTAWTWASLWRWVECLDAKKSGLRRGAKKDLEAAAKREETQDLPVLPDLFQQSAGFPLPPPDPAWLKERLLASKAGLFEYAFRVLARRGGRALRERPRVIVGTIHCSPPDELIATRRGEIPIAELQSDDLLVGYDRKCNRVQGFRDHRNSRGYGFERSARAYFGDLVVISSGRSRTRVTPNHRVVAELSRSFYGRWVVYLMRRRSWWRVGICTSGHRPYRSGGVSGRLATEQADAGWILRVCDSREDALAEEALIHGRYGIPGLTFEAAKARALSTDRLHWIHEQLSADVAPRAAKLLGDLGGHPEWPLYRRGNGWEKNMRTKFCVEAAALLPLSGFVDVPTWHPGDERTPQMETVTLWREEYEGKVYGLDVPPHHHYVSGGAVVHNSVKGGEADTVHLIPDLSVAAKEEEESSTEGADAIRRTIYVGLTRARDRVVIHAPHRDHLAAIV